jgi:hypothetical protein
MQKTKGASYIVLLVFFAFLFSGCTARDAGQSLKSIDKGIGKVLKDLQEQEEGGGDASSDENPDKGEEQAEAGAGELTEEQKQDIDKWLEENGYNRYGDSHNAVYTGGTPLFNEKTGESMGRYEYILKKFPNILERIKH